MFKQRLKQLRKEKGLIQKELADIFHMQNTAISKYELGERKPDQDTLMNLAKYFDVSLDYLTGVSDIRNPYTEDKDKYKKVDDIEEAMKIILEQPGLMLKGSILSDESKIILANAIQMGLRTAEEIEKKKNKGDSND